MITRAAALFSSRDPASSKAAASVAAVDELVAGLRGVYTFVPKFDDTVSISIAYDLADVIEQPTSALSSLTVRKTVPLTDKQSNDRWGTLTASGTVLLPTASPIVRVGVDHDSRIAALELNDAGKRVQVTGGRRLWNDRLTLIASPLITYGNRRNSRIDFNTWLPPRMPSALAGLPL